MLIQTETTPNPQTLRFLPGRELLAKGTRNFVEGDSLSSSPLAETIFKISGVKGVFIGYDFITVTKGPEDDWEHLKPQVLASLMDHLVAGFPVVVGNEQINIPNTESMDEITKQIVELIEVRVRPAVAQDGGDIIFQSFTNGVVYVELHGSCSGCPSSTITLKNGIENMLKYYVPEVVAVEAV